MFFQPAAALQNVAAFSSHYTLVALGMPPRLLRDAPYIMFRKCSFSDIYELVFLIDFASIVLL